MCIRDRLTATDTYHIRMAKALHLLKDKYGYNSDSRKSSSASSEKSNSKETCCHYPSSLKIPALKCGDFSGDKDKHSFRYFLQSFNNVYGERRDISKAIKLQYLKSHLKGYALKDIEFLSGTDDNYDVALTILKEHYLDKAFIIDSILHELDSAPPLDGRQLEPVRSFILKVRANLKELKELGVDFFQEDSSGCKLISHIVVDKLPISFLRELKLSTKEQYPSINLIFKEHNQIIHNMERFRTPKSYTQSPSSGSSRSSFDSKRRNRNGKKFPSVPSEQSHTFNTSKGDSVNKKTSSPSSSNVQASSEIKCKLCSGKHFLSECTVYESPKAKRDRCVVLKLCSNCSSLKHMVDKCPAKTLNLKYPCLNCKSRKHLTALCPSEIRTQHRNNNRKDADEESNSGISNHLCINTGQSSASQILPTITITVRHKNKSVPVRSLIDLGSQRTYASPRLLNKFDINCEQLPKIDNPIKTFIGEQDRSSYLVDLDLNCCCDSFISIPVLVDPSLDVGFTVNGLASAICRISSKYKVADNSFVGPYGDSVNNIDLLLGTDTLCHMRHFQMVECLEGSAISTCFGLVPFGPVDSFLLPHQKDFLYRKQSVNSSREHEEEDS